MVQQNLHKLNKTSRNIRSYWPVLLVFLLLACSKQAVYHEYQLFDNNEWAEHDSRSFFMEIEDTNTAYDLLIAIRHLGNYPYQNMWLFVEEIAPDMQLTRDTVYCLLADHTGRWHGKGNGSIYSFQLPLKSNFQYGEKGEYQYRIIHGMRDENLKGVNAVGLKLVETDGEK